MLFDTHAHYDSEVFDGDRDALLASMSENGVDLIVDPASDLATAEKARGIAEKFDFVYFAAGVHPHEASGAAEDYLDRVMDLTRHEKCVAIGEIGLDYHYDFSPRDVQRRVFEEQLILARELDIPVIIHEREACADCMELLRRYRDVRGVVHCFSGSMETAAELIELGFYISFTGVVTFKNARRPVEVAAKIPLDRLMIETDSPYMTPVPHRGERNSSLYLHCIAEKIASLRDMTPEELAAVTYENGKRFFGIV